MDCRTRLPFNEGGADCPPKLGIEAATIELAEAPSMKGGRTAPRNIPCAFSNVVIVKPSMKGGRTAPRNAHHTSLSMSALMPSMKGGRTAPRNVDPSEAVVGSNLAFNEGGADCPPKLLASVW